MRHWFLVFLIALLPIRGIAGEFMAGQMLGQRIAAAQAANVPAAAATETATAHEDCHGRAAPADAAAPVIQLGTDCGNCTLCQVCHSVAMAVAPLAASPGAVAHGQPLQGGTPFASAQPAPGLKPPIS